MNQKPVQAGDSDDKANDTANKKAIKWRHVFDWGFWNESPLASIVVFFIGGILLSSITNFPAGIALHTVLVNLGLAKDDFYTSEAIPVGELGLIISVKQAKTPRDK